MTKHKGHKPSHRESQPSPPDGAEAEPADDQPQAESAPPAPIGVPSEVFEERALSQAEIDAVDLTLLQAQAAEYLDGWQRSRAEFANYKKRVDRETEDARARITAEITTRYLPILDDLQRALKDKPLEGDGAHWAEGIELIYRKLGALLEVEGIELIPASGERFDPLVHEALTLEDSEQHNEGMVIEVIQQGYRLGDRILRPALVRVAK